MQAPRVNDKRVDQETGQRQRFSSKILPAWARKSPKIADVLPLLYLHGMSGLDIGPALEQFLGTGAGLSAATITRLTTQWQDEARLFADRSLAEVEYVYLWVDGIHVKVRLEQQKLCLLVMIGVRADGRKQLGDGPQLLVRSHPQTRGRQPHCGRPASPRPRLALTAPGSRIPAGIHTQNPGQPTASTSAITIDYLCAGLAAERPTGNPEVPLPSYVDYTGVSRL